MWFLLLLNVVFFCNLIVEVWNKINNSLIKVDDKYKLYLVNVVAYFYGSKVLSN